MKKKRNKKVIGYSPLKNLLSAIINRTTIWQTGCRKPWTGCLRMVVQELQSILNVEVSVGISQLAI